MKTITILALVLVLCNVEASHLLMGNIADRVQLWHHERVQYNAIPFVKRVKTWFLSVPEHKKILGIQALDMLQSKASINVTAGGVGHSFVNLRLKSERGYGLDYDVGIYVNPDYL
ncbi:uncharacterized protein LOC125237868 [Leguminivora glycinivorella]|uniref:uncharacterized protein LOC125237868 n=1 Tax=Leguminivora glycinivorella TaxID=1035111 RepID=UPI0020101D66|nr:uncharacterized protein LOC125237868 [Leguminivora glycinivorella]